MRSATAQNSIDQMRLWFVAYGLAKEVVSDNGPNSFHRNSRISLNRIELNTHWYTLYLHIIHCRTGQQSTLFNQAQEKHTESVKRGGEKQSLKYQLAICLFQYRNTSHLELQG